MSIEQALAELTAAVKENTAALKGGAGATATTTEKTGKTSTKADKTKDEPKGYEPKHTKDEMIAALTELKDKKGMPEAKGIIKSVGGKDKMGDISDPETIDKVYDAAKKALGVSDDEGDGL